MNQTARKRRTRSSKTEQARQLEAEVAAKDSLLDIVNLLLAREGGSVTVPTVEVQAATRHDINVKVVPPDPEVAGSQGRYVISLKDFTPEPPPDKSLTERMKAHGLWLPGRD